MANPLIYDPMQQQMDPNQAIFDMLQSQPQDSGSTDLSALSGKVQQLLGAKEQTDGGLAQSILSARFDTQPSYGDYASGVVQSALGKPAMGTDIASTRISDRLKTIALLERAGSTGNVPAAIQNYEYFNRLNEQQRGVFSDANRAPKTLNLGGSQVVLGPGGNVAAELPVTPKPGEMPAFKADVKTAEKTAEGEVDRQQNYTKVQSALRGFEQQSKLVTDTIDKAIAGVNNYSTGYGSYLSGLPNTDARKLNNYLNTIKANVGFDQLQKMRDNSPTGGALGQVSDMENKLLQAVNGALDPAQKDQLVENLNQIKSLYPQVLQEKKRAFQQDYGNLTPLSGRAPTQPAPIASDGIQPPTPDEEAEYMRVKGIR